MGYKTRYLRVQMICGHLIDSQDGQGGGSTRAEALGFNAYGWYVDDVLDVSSSCLKLLGDVGGSDVLWLAVGVIIGGQGCVGWCSLLPEMEDSLLAGMDGAEEVISR